jgi:hypothetical protein
MMIRQLCLCFGLLMLQSAYGQVQLTPANFSHIAQIIPSNNTAPVVIADLPQWVYLNSQQQLADLRVFNQDNIAVAHELSVADNFQQGRDVEVNAIPVAFLNEQNTSNSNSTSADFHLDAQGNIAIHIDGKVIKPESDAKISQWVVDASTFTSKITGFRFKLNSMTENFAADVTIESSEDLRHWQTISYAQKLLLLQNADSQLTQLSISIPAQTARYWRVRADGLEDLKRIEKITLQTAGSTSNKTEQLTIPCQLSNDGKTALCPLPTKLAINQLQIKFNQTGVAFNGLVKTYTEDSTKFPVDSVLLTLLSNTDNTVSLNGESIRTIELSTQNGDVLGLKNAPEMTVQWPAQHLRFLAHGAAPFILAVGSAQHLESGQQQVAENLAFTTAIIGNPSAQTAVEINKKSNPAKAKPWLLWGILAIAVMVLAGMAFKLLKD